MSRLWCTLPLVRSAVLLVVTLRCNAPQGRGGGVGGPGGLALTEVLYAVVNPDVD